MTSLALAFDIFARDNASPAFAKVGASAKAAGRDVKAAAATMQAAADAEANAAGKVRVAQLRLDEIRKFSKVSATTLARAEETLATAERAHTSTQGAATRAANDYAQAQKRVAEESRRARPAVSGMAAAFGSAGKAAGEAGARFRHVAAVGMAGMAKVAAGAALGVGLLGAAALKTGVQTAAGMETAKIGFTTMLGSATKADKFIRDLAAFAAKTPFDFPGLQQSASQLVAIGIKTKDVIPIMRTLGDVTSGMGTGAEGIHRAVIAIQQMNAAGKIQAQDLNQLRDAGVPVYELLSKATGKSAAAIANMAANGKLGRKELDQLMASLRTGNGLERFSGLMDKSSQSLAGLWSTLKDTFSQGMASAIAPALPMIKSTMKGISDALAGGFKWAADNKGSLSALFDTVGASLKSFGVIASAVFGAFSESFTGGKNAFKSFADAVSTNQAAITAGFVVAGKIVLGFGKVFFTVASVALKAFGFIIDAQRDMTTAVLWGLGKILGAAATAFGWIPGIGPKLKAAQAQFGSFSQLALAGMKAAGQGVRDAAHGIDNKLLPALDAAGHKLDEVGHKEIVKAQVRDAVKKAAIAVDGLGTSLSGAQIHLKKWSDRTHLSATEQAALRARLGDVNGRLVDQLSKMRAAGVGQDKLTAAWRTGRARLYDEFKQMGLSNEAARKLADRYSHVPPKILTKVTTPGMDEATGRTRTFDRTIRGIDGKTVKVKVLFDAGGKISIKDAQGHRGPQFTAAQGAVLPGFTPGRDVHDFYSPTGGRLKLSGGEAIMRPEFTKAIGVDGVNRMNAAARRGGTPAVRQILGMADGGVYPKIRVNAETAGGVPFGSAMGAATDGAAWAGRQDARWAADRILKYVKKATDDSMGGLIGPGGHVANPHGLIRVNNGWWTRIFAANIHRAEHAAGRRFQVYQGGWNHGRVRASGTTHDGDAIDARQDMGLRNAFRKFVGAMWFRNWPGNYHMHGVPAPGRGYGSASARWQYQDYKRGGDGLARGGLVIKPSRHLIGEAGPERVLAPKMTVDFERLVTWLERNGAPSARGPLIHVDTVTSTVDLDLIARHAEFRERQGSFT